MTPRLRAEERAACTTEQLEELEQRVDELGSVDAAVDAIVSEAQGDPLTELTAPRACLTRWIRERDATSR